jgi:GAF domain-containing protein
VPPALTFTIDRGDDIEATGLLVIISVAVTEVALWGRRQQARASRRSGYLEGVLGAAQAVSAARAASPHVTQLVAGQIAEVLDADDVRFVSGPVMDSTVAVLDPEGAVLREGHEIDVDRVGLPTHEYVAVPVRKGSRVVGHFLLSAGAHVARPSREQRRVASLLADQLAAADIFPMRLLDRPRERGPR